MNTIVIAGFGNLGAKLLPLRWAFPHIRFIVLERHGGDERTGFLGMRRAFDRRTLGQLLAAPPEAAADAPAAASNLAAFREALVAVHLAHPEAGLAESAVTLAEVFDRHAYFCGERGDNDQQLRYRRVVESLVETDRDEVLLYLATRPEDYLWYLERFGPCAARAAVDKPLATNADDLDRIVRFARLNPGLEIRPIDHYLFKLDFSRFNQALERRRDILQPRDVHHLEVAIHETGLDEHRRYFIDTGIVRDMMPHVSAMLRYMLRQPPRGPDHFRAHVGNVLPIIHHYPGVGRPTVVQAQIDLNYWTGDCYVSVTIRLGKGMPAARKEIVIQYRHDSRTRIDLGRRPDGGPEVAVDWEAALRYLMRDTPLAESVEGHFTFERACEITREVLDCDAQALRKVPRPDAPHDAREGETYFVYGAGAPPAGGAAGGRPVAIFNFDGVVVNTELAHRRAWNIWHELLGAPPPFRDDGTAPPPWFKPGVPNLQMIDGALADQQPDRQLAMRTFHKHYDLFRNILRSEKISLLREVVSGRPVIAPAEELARLRDYHRAAVRCLEELRRRNYALVLVSTNDELLVEQTMELLQELAGGSFGGFCRYFVGERDGSEACRRALDEYRDSGPVTVVDDYRPALDKLRAELALGQAAPGGRTVSFIHMHTIDRQCRCGESCDDWGQVARRLGVSI